MVKKFIINKKYWKVMFMRGYAKFVLIGLMILGLFCGGAVADTVDANFLANVTNGTVPLTVKFTDLSTNASSWNWSVGDGIANYTSQNPTHTYNLTGTYDVILTVSDLMGNYSTKSISKYITVSALPIPTADFSSDVENGTVPLTVHFTGTSTNATSWSWDVGDGTFYATQNVTHTYDVAGLYNVSFTASNAYDSSTKEKNNYINVSGSVPVVTPVANFSADVTKGPVPLTVKFTDLSTNASSWNWSVEDGTDNYTAQNPTHTYNSVGTYNVTLTVSDLMGNYSTKSISKYITVSSLAVPVADFSANVTEGIVPLTVKFTDLSTNTTSWSWDVGDETSYADQNVTHTYNSVGTYNVTLTATNPYGNSTKNGTINVKPKTYYTGDRIWNALVNPSLKYTWTAESFSGFYYDLDSGDSSETMTIKLDGYSDRSISSGDLEYITEPINTKFEYSDWGSFQIIGFMAERYFAGYPSDTFDTDGVSLISDGQMSKVLINEEKSRSIYAGSALILEEGYTLNVLEVDKNGNKVIVSLSKDGSEIGGIDIVTGGKTYVYDKDLGSADDVPIIAVQFDEIFQGQETSAAFVEGIFQISDEYITVEQGDDYGKMKVETISADKITMENDNSISLSEGKIIDIMGKIKFRVADDNTVRFAPFVDMTDPGTYELRGTVTEDTQFDWTPLNFEGFYYNIDEGIGSESLTATCDGSTIEENNLVYTAEPVGVDFEYTKSSEWVDGYSVIGFMAEKYFAEYPSGTFGTDGVSLISDGQLSKVLINEDKSRSIHSGSGLILDEGYVLNIIEVDKDGGKVAVSLSKDGSEIEDMRIVTANKTYVYEKDLGSSDDVPIIAVHFDQIFQGQETNAVFVDGIFQISDQYITVEDGDTYGEMEVTSISGKIEMRNENSISLSKGKSIPIMGDIFFKVADSDTVRYYPYVEISTVPLDSLNISMPASAKQGDEVSIIVTSRGAAVSDVAVKFDDDNVGKTSAEGTISFNPALSGTYTVTAEKEGYVSASDEVEVISPLDETKKMSIEVSPDIVYEGNQLTISVIKAIGGEVMEGVDVSYDGKSLGTTSSDGTISYTVKEPGMHKLIATRTGNLDAEFNLEVLALEAKFEFSNLVVSPLEVKVGKDVTITLNASNTGNAEGEYNVDLMINGNLTESRTVALEVDESTTIEFTVAKDEPGTYLVEVNGLSGTFEVLEKGGMLIYVLGILGAFAVAAVGYMFTAGGWTVEMVSAKVAEFIESIR